ncbi:hypothetical protein BN948_01779 [Hydrogenophaga intermedia]|uniref:Uncharacterized protein n=1 Tax=Hydrogenophaga intermedia TaxID=65786 RepID=A0A1L1PK99_HYDIT|nr:hypothetical protein [Hydrogenophaga intermedia]CDN87357.1 hypothetical protein BN948_01779 [Hydrogenophaga intermedia]
MSQDSKAFSSDIPVSLAASAFTGVSFTPERRGERARDDYAVMLAEDLAMFKAAAERGGTLAQLDDEFARYRAGMRSRYVAYLQSSSRCISSFIAGPSNFPVARAQKRNAVTNRRLDDLFSWREMARRAVMRNLRPDLRPIMAGDADAADRLAAEISAAQRVQEQMKAVNAALRKAGKAGKEAQTAALIELGLSEDQARELVSPKFQSCYGQGYPSFRLTNNQANIRRMQQRLEQIERAAAMPVVEKQGADGVRLEDDPPANRVRLFFPGKPADEVRSKLKSSGFRWAPSVGAWQAYRNARALDLAAAMVGSA